LQTYRLIWVLAWHLFAFSARFFDMGPFKQRLVQDGIGVSATYRPAFSFLGNFFLFLPADVFYFAMTLE